MTTFTGTNNNDVANAQTGTLTGFTGGNVSQLQDGTGDTFNAGTGNDTIVGGSGNDTIDGGVGADNLDGAGGSDTYNFDSGDVASGERITDTGTSGTDTLKLNSGDINFTAAQAISGIEALLFTGNGQHATFNADQLPASLAVTGVTGSNNDQNIIINNASNFSAAGWTFTNWTAGTDTISINGTTGADTVTGSSQRDTVSGGAGNDTLDGGAETDVAQFAGARSTYTIERMDSVSWRISCWARTAPTNYAAVRPPITLHGPSAPASYRCEYGSGLGIPGKNPYKSVGDFSGFGNDNPLEMLNSSILGWRVSSIERTRDLRWHLTLVGLADGEELGFGEGAADELDAVR